MWEFGEIKASKPYEHIIDDVGKIPDANGFSGPDLILRKTFYGIGTIGLLSSLEGKIELPERRRMLSFMMKRHVLPDL